MKIQVKGSTLAVFLLSLLVCGCGNEQSRWESTKNEDTLPAYNNYINQYPEGKFKSEAVVRIEQIEWDIVNKNISKKQLRDFIAKYPNGLYAQEAMKKIAGIEWANATELHTIEAYKEYLTRYPSGDFAKDAKAAIYMLNIVKEVEKLIFDKKVRAKGEITFLNNGGQHGKYKYQGKYEAIGNVKIPQGKTFGLFTSFTPGIRHKFIGKVCYPALGEALKISESIKGNGISNSKGTFDYDGPIKVDGEFTYKAKKKSRYFEIESDSADGLILEVTQEGYIHYSGSGRIRTPEGKEFVFDNGETKQ